MTKVLSISVAAAALAGACALPALSATLHAPGATGQTSRSIERNALIETVAGGTKCTPWRQAAKGCLSRTCKDTSRNVYWTETNCGGGERGVSGGSIR